MKAFYTDVFVLPLPPEHRFPMLKYQRLRERIIDEEIIAPGDLCIPDAATDAQLLLAHDAAYLDRVKHGTLTRQEIRRIGFPWSPAMVERSRRSTGATIAASRAALTDGVAANLAGGTHHAFADHGEGYCVFNDAAVALRVMQADKHIRRGVVIDCDVHQGNGTAAILRDDPTLFTFSIHGEKNFPFHKQPSDMDIELRDGTGDDAFLSAVEEGTARALAASGADLAVYLAGADPFAGDRLGRLNISMAGLAERDRIVLGLCRARGVPVAVTMAGGYAPNVEDIVAIHVGTIRIAAGLG